jgi:hypothetical protein
MSDFMDIDTWHILLGLVTLLQGVILYRHRQIDARFDEGNKTMNSFVREIAGLKVLMSAFDKEEFGRHRHRLTNLEIETAKIREEVKSIKERCHMLHDKQ